MTADRLTDSAPGPAVPGEARSILAALSNPGAHLQARVFSDEELRLGAMRSADALAEALDRGDSDSALRFARRLRREALSMFGNYEGWEATLLRKIRERHGDEKSRAALAAIEDPESAPERCLDPDGAPESFRATAGEIAAAIEAGETDRARALAQALHERALVLHDRGLSRVAALLSWIGRNDGSEAVEQALSEAMASDMLGDADFRSRAEALMHFTRVHLQPFVVEEDDEKLTFICAVCPSGGRLLREGHYDAPRSNLHIEGPAPLTYGRDSLPVYCCHEPVMEKTSIEATGVPLFIVEPSNELGVEPCHTYLYKDAATIPERFYSRLGLEKPR